MPAAGTPADRPRGPGLAVDVEAFPGGEPGRRFRCSVASEGRGEPLTATASTVRNFLLVEEPGPWGPALLTCHRLPERLRGRMAEWSRLLGIRPMLIRRPGRGAPGPRRVVVVNVVRGWARSAVVDDVDVVADLDLSGLLSGPMDAPTATGPVAWEPWDDPLLLVCTHGRHDACCAERGRPLAAALASRWPELVWECSHMGGDRFAANLLCLPDGNAYGRLDAETGPEVVAGHLAGRVSLEHHRGRTTVPWVAQAAEAEVRRRLDETRLGAVTSRVLTRDAAGADVAVGVDGAVHRVRVDVTHTPPAQLTCTAARPARAPAYAVRSLSEQDGSGASSEIQHGIAPEGLRNDPH